MDCTCKSLVSELLLMFEWYCDKTRQHWPWLSLFSLCVCVSVCFPYSGTSRNQAYKQQYQRIQRDTGMKYKKGILL